MTRKWLRKKDLDSLLRRSLADDLPADVDLYLRAEVSDFQQRAASLDDDLVPRADAWEGKAARELAPAWTWRRTAAAGAALTLAALGVTLQFAGAANPWSESVQIWQIRAGLQKSIRRATAMEARVAARDGEGRIRTGVVLWSTPGRISTRAGEADVYAKKLLDGLSAQLEPESLARRLDGIWLSRLPVSAGELHLLVRPPDGNPLIEAILDPATNLPVRIIYGSGEWTAELHWTLRPRESNTVLGQAGSGRGP